MSQTTRPRLTLAHPPDLFIDRFIVGASCRCRDRRHDRLAKSIRDLHQVADVYLTATWAELEPFGRVLGRDVGARAGDTSVNARVDSAFAGSLTPTAPMLEPNDHK